MSLKTKGLIVIAAVAAMSAGFWVSSVLENDNSRERQAAKARKDFSPIQGSIVSPARKIAVPALIKDNGQAFSIDDLTGQWHVLFFGYTHCPDICPTTMGVLAQAKKTAEAGNQMFPEVVFISLDPERDKVEMLGDYVHYFDNDFIAVTGDEKLIKALTLQMSVVYMKMPAEDNAGVSANDAAYLIDHSSALLLLNPEGKLVAFLNPPHDPGTILKDVQTVVKRSNAL